MNLHLIVLATALIIAGGFIINSFYDYEKDLVNKPGETTFQQIVSKGFIIRFYLLLNFTGLITALAASFNIFLFYFFFAFGLWIYSHKLKKIAVVAEISASLLTVASFFSIGLYYHQFKLVYFVYGTWMMTLIFGRELIKGIQSVKGDALFGYDTIPLHIGLKKTTRLLLIFGAMSLIPLAIVFSTTGNNVFKLLLAFAGGLTLNSLFMLKKLDEPRQFNTINTRFKILILAGVLWIIFL